MEMQNMALIILVLITITTGIIYGIFITFERKGRWPPHYKPYGYLPKPGLMGNRRSSLHMYRQMPVNVAENIEVKAADFSDKW